MTRKVNFLSLRWWALYNNILQTQRINTMILKQCQKFPIHFQWFLLKLWRNFHYMKYLSLVGRFKNNFAELEARCLDMKLWWVEVARLSETKIIRQILWVCHSMCVPQIYCICCCKALVEDSLSWRNIKSYF